MHKIFEANSSFLVKSAPPSNSMFYFPEAFARIDKYFVFGIRLGARL